MPGFNGSGVYELRYDFTVDAAGGVKILSSRQDEMWNDMKTGFQTCMTVDGQTTVTANIPMSTYKFTGLGAGSAATDSVNLGQLQDGSGTYVVTTGSSNAYVAAPSPAITSYAAGQEFNIEPNFTNTSSVTINVNALGTKAIVDNNGDALVGGELISGQIYSIQYDGTNFILKDVHGLIKAAGKETIWIPASAMFPATTSGASSGQIETASNAVNVKVLDFDASSDEYAHFAVAFPKSWDLSTVTFQAFWTTSATDTDGVAWGLQAVAFADNDALDTAYGTAVVVTDDAQGAANEQLVTSESSAITIAGTPSVNENVQFRIFRDVSDANDDMAEDARLIGIKLFFTTNARNDD